MGNHTGKDSHSPTARSSLSGSPLDFFHTPPTTPSEEELTAMALSSPASSSSSNKAQTPSPADSDAPSTTTTTSLTAEWTHKLSGSTDWAVISVESVASSETSVSDAAARPGKAAVSEAPPEPLPPSRDSPAEQSWQERDSGLEPQDAAERAEEEMTLVLLSLMEHQRASLGLSPKTDVTTGAVELLRRLITERDELLEEVDTLRETLRAERLEWRQFQCDLQVAVSVADRLRSESEQALGLLQGRHRAVEEQLALALSGKQEKDRELESLRVEHRDVCSKLNQLTLQQQQQAELDAVRNTCVVKDRADGGEVMERQYSVEGEDKQEAAGETEAEQEEKEANGDVEANGSGDMRSKGKGVAEGYLRSLAAMEKKKEAGRGPRDPRRIVMLSERSLSLSRLPLPVDSSGQNEASNTSTTLPLCKKEQPTKGRRMDRILQRQDSWSSFYSEMKPKHNQLRARPYFDFGARLQNSHSLVCSMSHPLTWRSRALSPIHQTTARCFGFTSGKVDEDQSSDYVKPQDGFSALLRRHGGSRRNSLLRWCQGRTQGYKNIDITNFSTSWEDGLAFCAIYHTYLPSHIPYESLNPEDKKVNLELAFRTGENVGVPTTLTVEEMLRADGPDWQRVLGYVESIFRQFEM